MPRDLLISLRDPHDPMAQQELRCFRDTTGLASLEIVHASAAPLDDRLLDEARMFFFGGSGAYSVLDPHPWVRQMLDFLVRVVDRKVPAWASCFGFQGLSLALGGEVNRDDARQELGVYSIDLTAAATDDPLFGPLPARFHAQLGHHDHVDRLPAGVTLLCTGTGAMIENQAFKVNNAPFWATQFHPELNKATTFERWNYYRSLYSKDEASAAATDRAMAEAPDTLEVQTVMRRFAEWAATTR
ncbi:MAG: type 1 glutamine amidotransferase [Pseudomonadota bacterium]|nr:type 1 glutamine amidotransferase [Pseudomonadota bacterium]